MCALVFDIRHINSHAPSTNIEFVAIFGHADDVESLDHVRGFSTQDGAIPAMLGTLHDCRSVNGELPVTIAPSDYNVHHLVFRELASP